MKKVYVKLIRTVDEWNKDGFFSLSLHFVVFAIEHNQARS